MTNSAIDDLSRLRSLAEEGRTQPLLGGAPMILWGSLVIFALLLQWAITTRVLPLPPMAIAGGWFGAMLLGSFVSRMPGFGRAGQVPAVDIGNRIERAVWQMGGRFLGLLGVSIFAAAMYHLRAEDQTVFFLLFALMPAAAFGVYAITLRATAEAAAMPALTPYAHLSLALVVATVLLAGSPWQFPVAALGIVLVAILPGRMILARARQAAHG